MKLFHGIGLVGCLTALSAGAWLGCSGDDSTNNPADAGAGKDTGGGGPDSSPGKDSSPGDDSAVGDDSGGGDDGGGNADSGPTPDCTTYCANIATACTGEHSQYKDNAECMNACKYLPVGKGNDSTGNTLGCRITHAGLAVANPVPHCWHAGPYGYGVCGAEKDGFCGITLGYCSTAGGYDGGPPPYASLADCVAAVPGFARADAGAAPGAYTSAGPTGGNTLDCREYHLGIALQSADLQKAHCQHPAVDSGACK